ncbi:pentapeptide repeat-containing protein [Clostridium sporogenes]|uniref:pentapeptide repeat-containing protein n=1 Tax=Clostridium sporogenes TaxID=1509 RepID=UPI0013D41E76|nr:pentapeptide repeat-containing protein [Clostridium sporogenes]MBA4508674.1 pentapeptide repeat-containing protein [Clostridium sporogenes]MDU6337275.1 pentapeptide repeat-containing protein [Clostridium sporogenes]NFQ87259.1 pentapeptide repeat-containing protein [Clostridium sporogenes]
MIHKDKDRELQESLKIDCKNCFGFCCTALYFSKSDGFPNDKEAGNPCINLDEEFKCKVHKELRKKGLKGCTAYDCFGAGQKVAKVTYKGENWRENPGISQQMFDVFLVMRQIHEMLWYLSEASRMQDDLNIKYKINNMIMEIVKVSNLDAVSLIKLDLVVYRSKVNALLLETSKFIRNKYKKGKSSNINHKKLIAGRLNLIGADLKKKRLVGENLSGALLIAADLKGINLSGVDFLGADLRDADLRGADLSRSIYLTQLQLNSAKGDINTQLPISLSRPEHWCY